MNIIETQNVTPKISYIMLPMYYIDGLLESQLYNLEYQTNKNFEVIILDPHFNKRKNKIEQIIRSCTYNTIYTEYHPNKNNGKLFDYSMWNNGVLLSNSNHISLLQDFRYLNREANEYLINNISEYMVFKWQISDGYTILKNEGENTVKITENQKNDLINKGIFPQDIKIENKEAGLDSWGHYLMSKNLWIELNGIDEHITSFFHHADLDLNFRIRKYYNNKNQKEKTKLISGIMLKISHNRNNKISNNTTFFKNGFVTEKFDNEHKNPCSICLNIKNIKEKDFYSYVINLVKENKYILLDNIELLDYFKNSKNKKEHIDYENPFIRAQCKDCYMTLETNFWWERIKIDKYTSSIGIGEVYYNGRNIKAILEDIKTLNLSDKLLLLKNSWNQIKYHKI